MARTIQGERGRLLQHDLGARWNNYKRIVYENAENGLLQNLVFLESSIACYTRDLCIGECLKVYGIS
jgi:hypothetical protein